MYSFHSGDTTFNFIDMPGFGDTSGDNEDELHKKRRYAFLEQIPQIHAIVTVVKATDTKLSPNFVGSLNDILSMVPKSAAANLMFFVTFSWSSGFQTSGITASLESYLGDVNTKYGVSLSTRNNIFYVDYFGFLYFLSHCKSEKYRRLTTPELLARAHQCWQRTTEAFYAMTRKVLALPGIPSTEIASINFARTIIEIVTVQLLDEMKKSIELRTQFDNPVVRAAQIRGMRKFMPKETARKTDEQVIAMIIKDNFETVRNVIVAALQALLEPAGFLKSHCVAPLSNGHSVRLQRQVEVLENNGEFDAAEECEAELIKWKEQVECFETILKAAKSVGTFSQTVAPTSKLFKLQLIGKRIQEAVKDYNESAKFEFEDTVKFKAVRPIQEQITS
uniref:G domain-containing protein n=1 Tax=Panagrellus redivivus TaxID=6233 RepID=A0A7E5A0Q1_PANRE